MSDTTTPNFGLTQPAPDGSEDTWGGKLNHDLDLIDAALAAFATGTIMDFAGTVIPNGWLLCDGRAISRTTYAQLFAAIGINFGAGDGMTTFNLPYCAADWIAGTGTGTDANSNTRSYTLGQQVGTFGALITQNNMPDYAITTSGNDGDHQNNYAYAPLSGFANEAGYPGYTASPAGGTTNTDGAHLHTVMLNGGGGLLTVTAPSLVLNRIIFAGGAALLAAISPSDYAQGRRILRAPMRGMR